MTTPIQLGIKILQHSNDGDDLSPRHLKLVEMGANGYLNDAGIAELERIAAEVEADTYQDWYFGIKGLWLDHQGYVYYKGKRVEHYSFTDGNYSEEARAAAQRLVKHLERGRA